MAQEGSNIQGVTRPKRCVLESRLYTKLSTFVDIFGGIIVIFLCFLFKMFACVLGNVNTEKFIGHK